MVRDPGKVFQPPPRCSLIPCAPEGAAAVIVDSSVVTSIFLRRPGHERLIDALAGAGRAGIGAPTLAEANAEISRATGADLEGLVSRFLQEFGVEVVPFGESHTRAAVDAWRRYGGGHGRAGLDLGGCLVYATA
ncbi:MAG: type II toxin-antitoxin system VapC family toxin, partial [Thermoanaerobaculia bacterium]